MSLPRRPVLEPLSLLPRQDHPPDLEEYCLLQFMAAGQGYLTKELFLRMHPLVFPEQVCQEPMVHL